MAASLTPSRAPLRLRLLALLCAVASLVLSGCISTVHDVRVRAANPSLASPTGTYQLVNPNSEPAATKGFDAAAPQARRALASKGLREAAVGEKPTWRVELFSGVTPAGQDDVVVANPAYAVTQPPRTQVVTTVTGFNANGTPRVSTSTRTDPMTEIVGYHIKPGFITMYTKYVFLRGYAADAIAPAGGSLAASWALEATIRDDTEAAADYLPLLATAAVLSLGKNIKTPETISFSGHGETWAPMRTAAKE